MFSIIGLVIACVVILGCLVWYWTQQLPNSRCDECGRLDNLFLCEVAIYRDYSMSLQGHMTDFDLNFFQALKIYRAGWLSTYYRYCGDCAIANGHCPSCGQFWEGANDRNFEETGICSNCYEPDEYEETYDEYWWNDDE